jgi:hypothetical protein
MQPCARDGNLHNAPAKIHVLKDHTPDNHQTPFGRIAAAFVPHQPDVKGNKGNILLLFCRVMCSWAHGVHI